MIVKFEKVLYNGLCRMFVQEHRRKPKLRGASDYAGI